MAKAFNVQPTSFIMGVVVVIVIAWWWGNKNSNG